MRAASADLKALIFDCDGVRPAHSAPPWLRLVHHDAEVRTMLDWLSCEYLRPVCNMTR